VTIHGANFQPAAKAALYGGGPYLVRRVLDAQAGLDEVGPRAAHASDLADGLLQALGAVRAVKPLNNEIVVSGSIQNSRRPQD
jgi:hypothetical protein